MRETIRFQLMRRWDEKDVLCFRLCLQQSTRETARPPSDVSLYLAFISLAVSAMALTVVSKSTRRFAGISLLAIMNPVQAFTAPNAQRSIQGIWTKPATGSHVIPR